MVGRNLEPFVNFAHFDALHVVENSSTPHPANAAKLNCLIWVSESNNLMFRGNGRFHLSVVLH